MAGLDRALDALAGRDDRTRRSSLAAGDLRLFGRFGDFYRSLAPILTPQVEELRLAGEAYNGEVDRDDPIDESRAVGA